MRGNREIGSNSLCHITKQSLTGWRRAWTWKRKADLSGPEEKHERIQWAVGVPGKGSDISGHLSNTPCMSRGPKNATQCSGLGLYWKASCWDAGLKAQDRAGSGDLATGIFSLASLGVLHSERLSPRNWRGWEPRGLRQEQQAGDASSGGKGKQVLGR